MGTTNTTDTAVAEDAPRARRVRTPSGDAPTREHLLEAALQGFAAQGFAATSVRELARDIGVHHNHFPQRFGTKERLWYAAVDHGFLTLGDDLLPVVLGRFPDEMSHLRAVLIRFVEANAIRPSVLRILNHEAVVGGPRLDYIYDNYIAPLASATSNLLKKLAARGEVRSDSVALMYFFVSNGAGGGPIVYPELAHRLGLGLDPSDPDAVHRHAEVAVDIFFRGLSTGS